MARLVWLPALLLTLLLWGLLSAAPSRSREAAGLRELLEPTGPDCRLPCWFGIRPGETRLEDAIAILNDHPWVGRQIIDADIASPLRAGALWWEWNGDQPDLIDASHDGRLAMENNVVRYIVIVTHLSMGDVQAWYGPPGSGMLPRALEYGNSVYHYASYGGVTARSLLSCPLSARASWFAPVQLHLGPDYAVTPFESYDLPRWLRSSPCRS